MKHILILAILMVSLVGCSQKEGGVDATGTFEATEVTVSSEVVGRVLSFEITEGTVLAQGVQIGLIDSTQLHLQKLLLIENIRALRSNIPSVSTQVAAIREQIRNQKTEKKRVQKLLKSDAATQKHLDDINSHIAVLNRQLAAKREELNNKISSIEAQCAAVEVQIAQINDKLSKCVISSPIAGVVMAKFTETGELLNVGRPIFKVADMSNVYLKAYVTSDQLMNIKLSQEVNVIALYGADETKSYPGRITWIADKSEFTPKNIQTKTERANLVYAIKIAVPNDGYIKLGMYGEVIF